MKAVRRPAATTPPAHSHSGGLLQEHDHEPVPGLPEALPAGEKILWQGAPDWKVLAVEAFHIRKLAIYFLLISGLRLAFLLEASSEPWALAKDMAPFLVLAISGLLIVLALAWLSAHHTLYTLTNRRVVMRIGIVLTVTFNVPYTRLVGAHLRAGPSGHGDVALEIDSLNRIPWLQLWPHARAWHLRHPQPTLRGIAQAEAVAQCLTRAWSEARGIKAQALVRKASSQATPHLGAPAL